MDWKTLIAAVVICELAGAIGSLFTAQAIPSWYASLAKPSFNPPGWVFAPVWVVLYAMMGAAAYLVHEVPAGRAALGAFSVQLALNVLWSVVFFGLHSIAWALFLIVILWLAIFWTMLESYKVSRKAAYLLVPYLLWVSFAGVLNYAIWMLNR
jgi:benzodiazapine receptor